MEITGTRPRPEKRARKSVTSKRSIEQLNSLLRGEISAAETYGMAIEKAGKNHESEATALRAISQEHGEQAQLLRELIRKAGGEADDASGPWGAWAKVTQGVADLFGDASALKALKEGEEHGLKDYREALDDVDGEARRLISENFIPAQQRHITTIDGILRALDAPSGHR